MSTPQGDPQPLGLQRALALSASEAAELYAQHVNPSLHGLYRLLGTHDLSVQSARGAEITLPSGRVLLDFSSSFGVTSLGHEHPRLRAAQERLRERGLVDVLKIGPTPLQGALAHDLAALLPAPLEVCSFGTSGAEAVEAALKLAERAQGPERTRYFVLAGSFHGKTHTTLALTDSGDFGRGFLPGLPPGSVSVLPFGDLAALERAVEDERRGRAKSGVIALVVEPLQGQSLRECPPGYLRGAAQICRREGILMIVDEVKVGLLRTGELWAFARHGIVPDILALAKGLAGGRHALGATLCSRELFLRAYGSRSAAGLHSSSMGGLTEACAVALEALSIYSDPGFASAVRARSESLERTLQEVAAGHPRQVLGLRGRGLVRGLELAFGPELLRRGATLAGQAAARSLDSLAMACLVRSLREEHGILAHFCDSDPTILHVMPPLVVEEAQIQAFGKALDASLGEGFLRSFAGFAAACVR